MVTVELEQFCKMQSCRELNSLQDGSIFTTICRIHSRQKKSQNKNFAV